MRLIRPRPRNEFDIFILQISSACGNLDSPNLRQMWKFPVDSNSTGPESAHQPEIIRAFSCERGSSPRPSLRTPIWPSGLSISDDRISRLTPIRAILSVPIPIHSRDHGHGRTTLEMSVTLSPTSRTSIRLIYLLSDTYEYYLFILFIFFRLLIQPAFIRKILA